MAETFSWKNVVLTSLGGVIPTCIICDMQAVQTAYGQSTNLDFSSPLCTGLTSLLIPKLPLGIRIRKAGDKSKCAKTTRSHGA